MDFELFKIGFLSVGLMDLLDILIVAAIFYKLNRILQGTHAPEMMMGLLLLVVAWAVALWAEMNALLWLISKVQTVWVIAFVILFQPELRRILVLLGQMRLVRFFYSGGKARALDEITEAARQLSERGYGALIAIERESSLQPIVQSGIRLEAEVSASLLVTIFTPRSPLHDLAVVVRGNVVQAANCLLPVSQSPTLDRSLGARHRAGLGLAEQTDAVVVVVSEETRAISLAEGTRLRRNLAPEQLRQRLEAVLAESGLGALRSTR